MNLSVNRSTTVPGTISYGIPTSVIVAFTRNRTARCKTRSRKAQAARFAVGSWRRSPVTFLQDHQVIAVHRVGVPTILRLPGRGGKEANRLFCENGHPSVFLLIGHPERDADEDAE
jgi:hypothetical protein